MCIVYPPAQQGHGGVIHHAFITLKMVDEYQARVLKVGYSARGVNGFPEFIVEKGHSLSKSTHPPLPASKSIRIVTFSIFKHRSGISPHFRRSDWVLHACSNHSHSPFPPCLLLHAPL